MLHGGDAGVAQGRRRRGGSPAMAWWRFPPLPTLPLDKSRV